LFVREQLNMPIWKWLKLCPKHDSPDGHGRHFQMKQPRKIVRRNPEARELVRNPLYRSKVMKSVKLQAARTDHWDRRAKHKTAAPTEQENE
jgi:hypothetical protein